jgi:hypothetical protein
MFSNSAPRFKPDNLGVAWMNPTGEYDILYIADNAYMRNSDLDPEFGAGPIIVWEGPLDKNEFTKITFPPEDQLKAFLAQLDLAPVSGDGSTSQSG